MAAKLKLDEAKKEEAELMFRRNQGLVNILESWSITQGHNRSVSKTPSYIIPIEETPLVPDSISDEKEERGEAWSPMPGEKDSGLKTPRHVPAKETLPSRDCITYEEDKALMGVLDLWSPMPGKKGSGPTTPRYVMPRKETPSAFGRPS